MLPVRSAHLAPLAMWLPGDPGAPGLTPMFLVVMTSAPMPGCAPAFRSCASSGPWVGGPGRVTAGTFAGTRVFWRPEADAGRRPGTNWPGARCATTWCWVTGIEQ